LSYLPMGIFIMSYEPFIVSRGWDTSRTCKAVRLTRVQAEFRRQSDSASKAEGGGHAPHGLRRHPGSGRGLLLGSFTFHCGGRWTRSTTITRPFAFQTKPARLSGSSS